MITIIFYGLDQFVVGRLSRELAENVAKLYEVNSDDVIFVAPNDLVFHNGVEQTSWNLLIHVHAPKRSAMVQDDVAKFLLNSIGDIAIHKTIEFYYYPEDNRYEKINPDYPRFISEDNIVDTEQDYDENIEEGDEAYFKNVEDEEEFKRVCEYIESLEDEYEDEE